MANVVFVQNLSYEFPGVEILSACLKSRGHRTDLLIDASPDPGHEAFAGADVLAFSVMTGHERWAVEAGRRLKAASGALVVLGGPHPTHRPEVLGEEGVDVVCRGEGEEALVELCDRIDARRGFADVANLWVKTAGGGIRRNAVRPPLPDLDALPFPDREIYYRRYPHLARNPHKPFLAGRGCPHACVFCSNEALRSLYGKTSLPVRTRSPEALVREIEAVRASRPLSRVFFHDDAFGLRRPWLEGFLALYRERVGLPFYCQVRADTVTEDLAARLRRAGCRCVFFAVESGVESLRTDVLRKNLSDAEIRSGARWLKAAGIRISTYNVIGIPGETLDDAFRTVEMNVAIGADYPRCSFLTPYPGTELARRAGAGAGAAVTALSQQTELLLPARDAAALRNLHALFQTAVLFPRCLPLVRRLVRWPLGPLYRAWWALVYGAVLLRSEGRGLRSSLPLLRFVLAQRLGRWLPGRVSWARDAGRPGAGRRAGREGLRAERPATSVGAGGAAGP